MTPLPVNDAVPGAVRQLRQSLRVKGLASAVVVYFSPAEDFAGLSFTCLDSNPRDAVTASDLLAVSLLDIALAAGGGPAAAGHQRRDGGRTAVRHPQRCRPVGGIG